MFLWELLTVLISNDEGVKQKRQARAIFYKNSVTSVKPE